MFMHWKVPTRLIVDDPSYRSQKAALVADSNQRFYEDINGTRECKYQQNLRGTTGPSSEAFKVTVFL